MDLTLLTEQNRAAFSSFLPTEVYEQLTAPEAVAIGAVDEAGTAVGAAVAVVSGEWLELVWIYVHEPARNQGVAGRMLERLILSAFELEEIRGVTARFGGELYLSPVHSLLKRRYFLIREEPLGVYAVTVGDVKENSFFAERAHPKGTLSLGELPAYTLSQFEKKLMGSEAGVPLELPVNWSAYDQGCSVGYVREGELRGILLFTPEEDGLELSLAYADPGEGAALSAMLRAAGKKLTETKAPDTKISLAALNENAAAILERLFPGQAKLPAYRAVQTFCRIGKGE